jgi:hypothetical protein
MLLCMDDTQREPRVSDETATDTGSREPVATASPVARMLANPRRVRRA